MDVMAIRRSLIVGFNRWLEITYGEGLNRIYERYDLNSARARTEDIPVAVGQTMMITIDNNIEAAVGSWDATSKTNILYGSWNKNLNYTPATDVLCKIVIRKKDNQSFSGDELRGKISVKVGNTVYKY